MNKVLSLVMTGLIGVHRFKICIQDCVLPGFPPQYVKTFQQSDARCQYGQTLSLFTYKCDSRKL